MVVTIERDNRFHRKRTLCKKSIAWAFLIFCLFGFTGILVDADHLATYLQKKQPLSLDNLSDRPIHIFVFVFAGFLLVYSFTYLYRLKLLVLKDRKRIRIPILK